jgi:hypothetical protein
MGIHARLHFARAELSFATGLVGAKSTDARAPEGIFAGEIGLSTPLNSSV